jgi:hypothetical protein
MSDRTTIRETWCDALNRARLHTAPPQPQR